MSAIDRVRWGALALALVFAAPACGDDGGGGGDPDDGAGGSDGGAGGAGAAGAASASGGQAGSGEAGSGGTKTQPGGSCSSSDECQAFACYCVASGFSACGSACDSGVCAGPEAICDNCESLGDVFDHAEPAPNDDCP